MNKKSKSSKSSTATKLNEGDIIDLNTGYFTAPYDGILIIDDKGFRFEKVCDFCDFPCENPECFTKEK